MTAIREKDKLFVAVALPLAALAAYAMLWRAPHLGRVRQLRQAQAALVEAEDFPAERAKLERRAEETAKELEAARAEPPPAETVKGSAEESVAERERRVLDAFRAAGVRVVASAAPERGGDGAGDARGGEVLRGTGLRPDPRERVYRLEGGWTEVRRALDAIVAERMAAIPERVSMTAAGRWTMRIWL